MRGPTIRILGSVLAVLGLLGASSMRAVADAPPGPPPPTSLTMAIPGTGSSLPPGSWTGAKQIVFRFDVTASSGAVTPEVELESSSVPFKNQPNLMGPRVTSSGSASVPATSIANGQTYHWQARVINTSGLTSPWVSFGTAATTGVDFGVDQDPPSRPVVQSPTDPNQNRWYNNRIVTLQWSSNDALSGLKGYSYVIGKEARTVTPAGTVAQSALRITALADGVWFVTVRAVDRAGNWSPAASFRLQLDRQPPRVTWLSPGQFTFNPYRGPASVRFRVNEGANVQVSLYQVGRFKPIRVYSFAHLPAGQTATITWNGRDGHGRALSRGYYFFATTAIDRAANRARWNFGGIRLDPQQPFRTPSGVLLYPGDGKRIIVSLSRQTLYAYEGVRLVLQTVVTTGNPSLPTPPGSYTVLGKYHPYEFVSPWPPSSPYWYPPSWSQYAMLFRGGGYFLHDAPWRSTFGPGTNGPGQPGTNFGGTHGCVNIPPSPMLFLWNWTPVGTPVLVVP